LDNQASTDDKAFASSQYLTLFIVCFLVWKMLKEFIYVLMKRNIYSIKKP